MSLDAADGLLIAGCVVSAYAAFGLLAAGVTMIVLGVIIAVVASW